MLESTVDIALTIDFSKKSVEIDRRCGFYQKKNQDSPILHNKKMYVIDSDAHFCSPGPISSASHKTTHKKETNTHRQDVYDGHRQEYFMEELIVEKMFSE